LVKKAITIRLNEEMLKEIDDRGKRTTVIRNIIEYALRPKKPTKPIKTKIRIVEKEIPIEVIKYVIVNPFNWNNFDKENFRDVINNDIRKGMPKWYLDSKVKDWEREYGEKF